MIWTVNMEEELATTSGNSRGREWTCEVNFRGRKHIATMYNGEGDAIARGELASKGDLKRALHLAGLFVGHYM